MELIFRNLCIKHGKKVIIKNMNMDFKGGQVVGLIGYNGVGKTTLLKAISGLKKFDGEILFDGMSLAKYRKKNDYPISILLNDIGIYRDLSAVDNIKIEAIYNNIPASDVERLIDDCIGLAGLENDKKIPVRKYSLGMLRRLQISMLTIKNADVVLLDEPFNGLDQEGILLVRKLIEQYRKNRKIVFVSSHTLQELKLVCDKFMFVNKGEVSVRNNDNDIDIDKLYEDIIKR